MPTPVPFRFAAAAAGCSRPPRPEATLRRMAEPDKVDFEKLGVFYLGREYDLERHSRREALLLYDSRDLVTRDPFQTALGGQSDLLAFSVSDGGLEWCSYLGGGLDDYTWEGWSKGGPGGFHLFGQTTGPGFPVVNAFQPDSDNFDIFVMRIARPE